MTYKQIYISVTRYEQHEKKTISTIDAVCAMFYLNLADDPYSFTDTYSHLKFPNDQNKTYLANSFILFRALPALNHAICCSFIE